MKKTHRMTIETGNEQILKDRRGRQWQTTPGLKNCLGNPDTGTPGVYSDSKESLLLLNTAKTKFSASRVVLSGVAEGRLVMAVHWSS